VPVQLIVAAFNDEKAAKEALDALKEAQKEKLLKIENAAILRKDEKGKLHITETADMGGKKGAVLGGVAGAAIGLIAGPLLLVPAAFGALAGGLAAKLRDSGFSDARLEMLGEGLKPGSSAIVAVVEHTWTAQVEKALAEAKADLLTAAISADISDQLEAGHQVAYTAIASEQGFAAARVAGGDDSLEAGQVVVDESGVYGERFVATKDGFAVVAMEATDEGVQVAGLAAISGEEEADEPVEDSSKPEENAG
jgi:uncharacterized membrane protein